MPDQPTLSVIIPAYNEAEVIERALREISQQLESIGRSWEILVIDDGSRDTTPSIVEGVAAQEPRIQLVWFARNFGKEAAIQAGLDHAKGEAVILLDADLQHPPSLLPEMVSRWDDGFDIVEATKKSRGRETVFYALFAKLFYGLFLRSTGVDLNDSSDFQLLDRQCVDILIRMPEKARFFRGLSVWLGFQRTELTFEVADRAAGESSWSTWGLARYALTNLLSFSSLPLYLSTFLGMSAVTFAGVIGGVAGWDYISGQALDGFTTVIIANSVLTGMVLICLGILSTYVALLLKEIKNRPTYIVRRRVKRNADRGSGVR